MIRLTPRRLLVYASPVSTLRVPKRSEVTLVAQTEHIFPAIHKVRPHTIIFDYQHAGPDLERVLRRLRSNPFYRGVKIHVYKAEWHTRTDDFLQTLGVNKFIYEEELAKEVKQRQSAFTGLSNLFEQAVMSNTLAEPSF